MATRLRLAALAFAILLLPAAAQAACQYRGPGTTAWHDTPQQAWDQWWSEVMTPAYAEEFQGTARTSPSFPCDDRMYGRYRLYWFLGWTLYVQRMDYRGVADPVPMPAVGCAAGAGGFYACPGNSAPSGTPTGPWQNLGPPGQPVDTAGPQQSAEPLTGVVTSLQKPQSCRAVEAIGDPVHAGTGNVFHQEMDFSGRGPQFWRAYNSSTRAWTHNHMLRVIASATRADLVRPDGRILTFEGQHDGLWTSNGTVDGSLQRLPAGGAARWRYVNAQDDVESYDASGMPMSVIARNGQALTYQTSGGRVVAVSNSFGRRLSFTYDGQGRLAGATLPDGQPLAYAYDTAGRLAQVSFADGTSRQYLYGVGESSLLLTGVVDEAGVRFASWSYDAQGRAVTAAQADGANAAQLAYGSGTTTVMDALGTSRTMQFATAGGKVLFAGQSAPCTGCVGDAATKIIDPVSGLVSQSADPLGVTTMFTWDVDRKLPLSTTSAAGRAEQQSVQVQWHPVFRLPVQVDAGGRSTRNTYDASGNLLSSAVTDAQTGEVRTTSWTYSELGLVLSASDSAGRNWQFTYDASGNLTSSRDPIGRETLHTYDAGGRLVETVAPGGLVTRYGYDARGRLTEQRIGSDVTRLAYTPTGLLAQLTAANGQVVSFTYDGAHRLVAVSDNRGAEIRFTRDAFGNAVRQEVRDAAGNLVLLTSTAVDALNRVAAVHDSSGRATRFEYDANGELVGETDPLGLATRRALDGLRRTTEITLPDSSIKRHAWNALDQLEHVVDPKGVMTGYVRNAFGEVLREASPDIGALDIHRDAAGAIVATRDAKGQLTTFEQDALGRVTTRRDADGAVITYRYDTAGFLSQVQDRSGSTTFSRDEQGRVLGKTQLVNDDPAAPSAFSLSYTRGAGGALASIRYPSGLTIDYHRDTTGRIVAVDAKEPGGTRRKQRGSVRLVSELRWSALGWPTGWRWSNGDSAVRSFDADGRMVSNEFASYSYDAGGRIQSITHQLWARKKDGPTETFLQVPQNWAVDYDSRSRITGFSRAGNEARYTYDANSNRLTAVERRIQDANEDGEFDTTDFARTEIQHSHIDAASNRLLGLLIVKTVQPHGEAGQGSTSGHNVAYTVDANGSLTSDGRRAFEYDASGRLARMILQRDVQSISIRYLHNAMGQRVFKGEPQADQVEPDAAVLGEGLVQWLKRQFGWLFTQNQATTRLGTAYVYGDGDIPPWALLGEYDNGSSTGAGRTEYIWLPLEDGSAIPVAFWRGGRFFAVHTDHLGTPRLVTDEDKVPVWQWPYSAFGQNKPTGLLRQTANPRAATPTNPLFCARPPRRSSTCASRGSTSMKRRGPCRTT